MKTLILLGALAIGCGDDGVNTGAECGVGTTLADGECVADAVCGTGTILMDGMCIPDGTPPTPVFRQIEHLARPGISEALLLTDGFLEGYNATAPSFTGVPAATLNMVVDEAKTVLKALYLSSCLISGAIGLTAGPTGTALKPALIPCVEVGGNIFVGGNALTGTVLTDATKLRAQEMADKAFAQFVPDVMRINTGTANNYLTVCGDPTAALPLLCGGRRLDDDVIDITYNYLIGGLAGEPGAQIDATLDTAGRPRGQVRALTSDGVAFDTASIGGAGGNKNGLSNGVGNANRNQGHPAILTAFPYSAAPF